MSVFWVSFEYFSSIRWVYLKYLLSILQVFFEYLLSIFQVYFKYLLRIFGISWVSFEYILSIFYVFCGHLSKYFFYIFLKYLSKSLSKFLPSSIKRRTSSSKPSTKNKVKCSKSVLYFVAMLQIRAILKPSTHQPYHYSPNFPSFQNSLQIISTIIPRKLLQVTNIQWHSL